MMNDSLAQTLKLLPDLPGCYLYYDSSGEIIYVGKAKNLKRRVKSYFNKTPDSPKLCALVPKIEKLEYIQGKYLNITNDKYHEDNERQLCLMKTTKGFDIIFVQIAGMVARRIVCNLKEGQEVKAGERYGCIKFGSRVDLYLPKDIEIKVKVGQTMIAGETVIGLVKTTK